MVDIDIAVARARRRKAETEPKRDPPEPPMRGECAVCGAPVPAPVPPRKDPGTPRFCDEHDEDDLRAVADYFEERRREQVEAYRKR